MAASGSAILSASASAKTPALTGAPIVVATEAPIGSAAGSVPQVFASVKAAARAINKSGGIQGHPLQVQTCNGMVNPNAEANCASSAVAAGAVAMVGNLVFVNPQAVENTLQSADTADLGATAVSTAQFSSPVSFPLIFEPGTGAVCTSRAFSKIVGGSRVAAAFLQIPPGLQAVQVLQHSAQAQGTKYVGQFPVGFTTVDFSPVVQELSGVHPNVVFAVGTPPGNGSLITAAAAAGETWNYCLNDGSLSGKQLAQLGPDISKLYEASPLPPLSAARQFPELQRFISQMHAEEAAGDADASVSLTNYVSQGLTSWLGMQAFAQVARSIKGPITHTTVLAALKTAKVNLGLIAPIDFSNPIGSGTYPRVFNARQYLERWVASKKQLVLVPSGTVKNSFAISWLG
jgi:ABC-type branched-subunit amino acid transport system substrate-binding protein